MAIKIIYTYEYLKHSNIKGIRNLHKIQGTFYMVNNTSVNEDGLLKQKHINY